MVGCVAAARYVDTKLPVFKQRGANVSEREQSAGASEAQPDLAYGDGAHAAGWLLDCNEGCIEQAGVPRHLAAE